MLQRDDVVIISAKGMTRKVKVQYAERDWAKGGRICQINGWDVERNEPVVWKRDIDGGDFVMAEGRQ